MSDLLIGIDLGGTNVRTALVSRDKDVLRIDSRPTNAHAGLDAVLDVMAEGVHAVLHEERLTIANVLAAGIGAPGPMNPQTGVVFSPPNLPGWKDVPLADAMSERLGIPCFVDNDANLACYGEFWMGAAQGCENVCLLTLGTGVGGGIIVNGKLLRGVDGTAAEIGHMIVNRDGRRCGCGTHGCLEAYGSVTGLLQTAREGMEQGETTTLTERCSGDLLSITGQMISEAADAGDAYARSVLEDTGVWLGVAIASLINLFNPERVVLAGGMTEAGDVLLDAIRNRARQDAFEVPGARAEIVVATLAQDAGVLGAAGVALDRYESA